MNPLLAAASPLLCALAQCPVNYPLVLSNIIVPYWSVNSSISDVMRSGKPSPRTCAGLRYCLCTSLDEAANNTTWGRAVSGLEKACWSLFMEKVKAAQAVSDNWASGRKLPGAQRCMEIIYHILGLGFEGRYSVRPTDVNNWTIFVSNC